MGTFQIKNMKIKTNSVELASHSSEQTRRLGISLGRIAQAGDLFLLAGTLGSGKTCLAQGIACGLAVQEYAVSPTFVLVREYHGRLPMYHIDLYRLDNIEEVVDLALEEYLHGNGVCVIEWAEKGLDVLPHEHLLVRLSYVSDSDRLFMLEPHGERYRRMLTSLEEELKNWN
jgi:tRNA threonylcarbamoyladenosine biosynthesis protein TsaE